MPDFIRRRDRSVAITHRLFFQRKGDTEGSGYSFPCDAVGKVDADREAQVAELRGDAAYEPAVVEAREQFVVTPAVIRCTCGKEVQLHGFTNTCDCQRDYNMSGQLLGPRANWGEETGEHWTDCI